MLDKTDKSNDPTRERILEAALDLFGERGLTGTTVRDIATRAEANVAAISYHFGGKDELYRAVAERAISGIESGVRGRMGPMLANPPRDPASALKGLETFVETMVDVIVGPPEMRRVARFIIREQMQPTAAFEILYVVLTRLHGAVSGLLAVAAGLDPSSKSVGLRAFLLVGQLLFLRIGEVAILTRLDLERYDEAFLANAKRLLRQHVRAIVAAAKEAGE